jgi:hypothetical protein
MHKWRAHTLEENEYKTKSQEKVPKDNLDNDGEIAKLAPHLSQWEPCYSLSPKP